MWWLYYLNILSELNKKILPEDNKYLSSLFMLTVKHMKITPLGFPAVGPVKGSKIQI
jgi:hypothetical protein